MSTSIDIAELLTRATIWFAIAGYAIGTGVFVFSRYRSARLHAARTAWTIACVSLIAHFICAFHFYHDWSHELAYRDTARQTRETVALNWGGGLFINYAVLIAWIADVGWWWLRELIHIMTGAGYWLSRGMHSWSSSFSMQP